jgi:vacuolar-type H+-ATPase subunit D/Vma8
MQSKGMTDSKRKWMIQRTLKLLERKRELCVLEIEKMYEMRKLLERELKKL